MTTSTLTSPVAGALLAPANFIANAEEVVLTTLAQIAAAGAHHPGVISAGPWWIAADGVYVRGHQPRPSKIEVVLQIPVPETITHLRSFLGMCIFFRAHLPAFAEIRSAYGVAQRK
jgi:hypothetical protein